MYDNDDDGLSLVGQKTPAAFDVTTPIGTTVGGVIVEKPVERDVTDFHTKEVRTFPDGSPMRQYVIRVQTDLRDPAIEDDDGVRAIYVKGWNKKRLRDAVMAAGVRKIQTGGQLFDTYAQMDGQHKVHTYRYVPPAPGEAPPPMPPEVRALGTVTAGQWVQMNADQRSRLLAAAGAHATAGAGQPPF